MTESTGRFAIFVDGINMPGFNSLEEAQAHIDKDPKLQKKGAVATGLTVPRRSADRCPYPGNKSTETCMSCGELLC